MGIRELAIQALDGLSKALKPAVIPEPQKLAPEAPKEGPTALLWDPFALLETLGYRERYSMVSYDALQKLAFKVPVFPAILQIRRKQVLLFSRPQHDENESGYKIRMRDKDKTPAKKERMECRDIEEWISHTGSTQALIKDGFDTFLEKYIWDSLVFDQACHPAGTLIETECGRQIAIEDVNPELMVRSHSGHMRRVLSIKRRTYTGEMIRIWSGGQVVEATAGHPFLAVTDRWFRLTPSRSKGITPDWVAAKDLRDEHYLVYPKPKIEERDISFDIFTGDERFYSTVPYAAVAQRASVHPQTARAILCGWYQKRGPAVDAVMTAAEELGWSRVQASHPKDVRVDEGFAQLCGLYAAEGSTGDRCVRFDFHEDEQELHDVTIEQLQAMGVGVTLVRATDKHSVTIIGNSVDLAKWFGEQFGCGCANKHIPEWMMECRAPIRAAFIGGYLAGDANLRASSATIRTRSLALFGGIRVILASLGSYLRYANQPERYYCCKQYERHNREMHTGSLSGCAMEAVAGFTGLFRYETPNRPRAAFIQDDEFYYIKISGVSRTEVEDLQVYNLEVEDDHSFVANGFVSHNCFEVVENRKGEPADFYAVDGASIRIVDHPWDNDLQRSDDQVRYVQVHDASVVKEFTPRQLCFGVRNPRTDLRCNGYGISELELGIKMATSMIFGFDYNSAYFTQGTVAKGMLNLPQIPDGRLRIFAEQWHLVVSGIANAWRTPITNFPDAKWIDLQKSNRDMEFGEWINFLIKLFCALALIDPTEINFLFGNTGQSQQMFQSGPEQRVKHSKDKGLRPLLMHIERMLNRYVIWRINPELEFVFTGLDPKEAKEEVDIQKQQTTYLMTVDEMRKRNDLPPLEDGKGECILDATWNQFVQAKAQAKQQEKMMQQQGGQPGQPGQPEGGGGKGEGEEEEQPEMGQEDWEKMFNEASKGGAGGGLKKAHVTERITGDVVEYEIEV
jgi:hypothetical protein